ncbi:GlxA family transcriptional regulator [Antarctobacter heliothermus]|uniref:Transcriptional regulator, AraC family with amidase-like domain n=1 Tax=Antarctobacter heliothermus TaxID=74033 RepID=A0A239EI27_9RHOB|nr:helix-turn-helix domain-containing protein [Antarctobacter heliothermus]SNS43928.1 transcriptional regulator, AraC family with amidase-like domain [Antarctobacter heliothermus]
MHICLILFPGFPMLAHVLAREVLQLANDCAGQHLFSVQTRTVTGTDVVAADGTAVAGDQPDWHGAQGFDLVLLCAGHDPLNALPMGLRAFLNRAEATGATLGGLDGGAVILARLGYLTGRTAVLDHAALTQLDDKGDTIALTEGAFSCDRQRLTTAGGMATGDALLAWIARAHSPALAARVAESLAHGRIGQAGAQQRLVQAIDPLLDRMQAIMAAHIEHPIPVERVAAELELSPKQLRLRCRKGLGQTPAQVYNGLRLDRAAQLISATELSVQEVARAAGFASPSAFTRSYRARFGAPPRSQRRARRTGEPLGQTSAACDGQRRAGGS